MITCTGLWLTCFVILFLYTSLLSFPRLLSTGLLLLLSKRHSIFASRKRLALTESLFFWRPKNLDFLYFAVSLPCFNQLRLWWNCAFWIDDNMHWALIDSFLWYSFCIHDYFFICGCFLMACYYCFQKALCNFVPQGNACLWLSLCFLET